MIRPAVSKPAVKPAAKAGQSKGSGWLVAGIILGQAAALAAGYGASYAVSQLQAGGTINLPGIPEDQASAVAVAGLLFMGMILGPQLFAGLAAYRQWKPAFAALGAIFAGGLIAWMWAISTFGNTFEGVTGGAGIHAAWIAAGLVGALLSTARRKIEA